MLDALKARAMKVDAANEPYDAEIKLCFPGTRDPANATPYNETILTYGQTGGGWNPGVKNTAYIWGYATTSYQVIFNTGDGSKVDTQIVKYGELATEPTTELKGYDFLGWFDADGNPFDFNNTEITHKTTLTAKWEKKTYIIASAHQRRRCQSGGRQDLSLVLPLWRQVRGDHRLYGDVRCSEDQSDEGR